MPSTRADRARRDEALETVRAAKAGDPRAVREILRALEVFLRGRDRIPRCYALFCAASLNVFLKDKKAWGRTWSEERPLDYPGADKEFATRDRSSDSPIETILGLGARLSERRLRRIGTAACRAFHLTQSLRGPTDSRGTAPSEETAVVQGVVIRFKPYTDMRALKKTDVALTGDPRALRRLLRVVEKSLRKGDAISGFVALFVADAFQRWTEDEDAWERMERSGQGARPVPPTSHGEVYKLSRSFCRAFHLSRPQGRLKPGEVPQELGCSPTGVYTFERLLAHGVTWSRALAIVSGAYPGLSSRTLDEWARLWEISSRKISEGRLMANRLDLAERVVVEIAQGRSHDDAELKAARWLAQRLFPSGPSRLERWAERVVQESETGRIRPEEQLKLARRINSARRLDRILSKIPDKIYQEILPEVVAEETDTFLPDPLIAELIPAVRKAHALALEMVDQWPSWARLWPGLSAHTPTGT